MADFIQLYAGVFTPESVDREALRLAQSYVDETEAYDRTVCTGPVVNGSIRPANHYQLGLINRNALKVRHRLRAEAQRNGIDWLQVKKYIGRIDANG